MNIVLLVVLLVALCSIINTQGRKMPIDVIVSQDGSGNFTKISDAIAAAPNFSARRYNIKITAGLYVENIEVAKKKTNLVLFGDGMNNTIVSGNKSADEHLKTSDTATAVILGEGFVASDLTFQNTAGPYKGQAVALRSEANKTAFFRCRFKGYQDTLYPNRGTQFFRDCEIHGTVDFICGQASAVFQNCKIYAGMPINKQKNTITAQKRENYFDENGTIIQNCTITAGEELRRPKSKIQTFLGRPWGNFSRTIIMQSFLDDIIDPEGWLEWPGHSTDTVLYAEYDNRGPGSGTEGRVAWSRVINRTEASRYTARNFIHGEQWVPSTGIPYFLDLL